MHRSWSAQFQQQNAPNVKTPTIFVEPIKEWSIFRGDRVQILRGKDCGKQGIVNYVVIERNWVCVEGLNCKFVTNGRTREFAGFTLAEEMPLLVNRDVALVDPTDQKPTAVEWRYDDEGNKVRVSVRTARIIPIPTVAYETTDFKAHNLYTEQQKDTQAKQVKITTFEPKLNTFEMEIMDQMDIKEHRIPYPMYWY